MLIIHTKMSKKGNAKNLFDERWKLQIEIDEDDKKIEPPAKMKKWGMMTIPIF